MLNNKKNTLYFNITLSRFRVTTVAVEN